MNENVIMLLVTYGKQQVEIIDHSTDYFAIAATIGDTVYEAILDGDIVILCSNRFSTKIIRTYGSYAITGEVFLVAARAVNGYRSLTAREINKYKLEFEGYSPWKVR